MNTKKIIIFDDNYDDLTLNLQNNNVSVYDNEERVVKLYEPGPQGAKGDRGDTGLSGISEPFYLIVTGSLYAVTASIAFQGQLSSSLLPYTTSYFDLGSNFPSNTTNTDIYDLTLFSPSSIDCKIYYEFTRLNTGHVATGSIENNNGIALPSNNTLLTYSWLYRTNNTTAAAVGIDIVSDYIETDY